MTGTQTDPAIEVVASSVRDKAPVLMTEGGFGVDRIWSQTKVIPTVNGLPMWAADLVVALREDGKYSADDRTVIIRSVDCVHGLVWA